MGAGARRRRGASGTPVPGTRAGIGALVLGLLLAVAGVSPAAGQDGAPDGQWPVYGGDAGHTRYAPLEQIDADNAADLEIAWRWKARNYGARPETKYEVTPLMVDGVLYAQAGFRRQVVAIDAGTGETLWTWRLDEGERGRRAPRRNSGRGVAYWGGDGDAEPRIYSVTPGYRLVALEAATGRPVAEFGDDGIVDLMEGVRRRDGVPLVGSIGASSPPVVVNDVVVVGSAQHVGFRPPSPANVPGDVRAFDARTGRRRWTFHTVPEPGEPGVETWEDESWRYTGNAGVWAPFSADPGAGLVYLPTEAATHDYYGGHRLGDNLYASSLVCLDADTGRRVWHRQLVHHDVWDYDMPTAPILVDLEVVRGEGDRGGAGRRIERVPAVVQLTKMGFAFVFDRRTGEPVWPIEERPVPSSDVPGERLSPTQPFPTRPPPLDRQGLTEDDLIDFTPELRGRALEILEDYRLGPLYAPPSLRDAEDGSLGTLQMPGALGAASWEAGAVDPETHTLFVGTAADPSLMSLEPGGEASEADWLARMQTTFKVQGLPIVKPPYGRISAVDLGRGERRWWVPNGDAPDAVREHPALEGFDLPHTGKPTRSGVLATRTLLFAGEGWGGDPVLRALDKATGRTLAEIPLPAAQVGLPMTYLHRGTQYVVVAVGAPDHPGELVALRLPR